MKLKRGGFLGLAASLDHPQRAAGGNAAFILRVPIKWMEEENKRMGDFLPQRQGGSFPVRRQRRLRFACFYRASYAGGSQGLKPVRKENAFFQRQAAYPFPPPCCFRLACRNCVGDMPISFLNTVAKYVAD